MSDPDRYTKHVYSGLTKEDAVKQFGKCSQMSIDIIVDGNFMPEVRIHEDNTSA